MPFGHGMITISLSFSGAMSRLANFFFRDKHECHAVHQAGWTAAVCWMYIQACPVCSIGASVRQIPPVWQPFCRENHRTFYALTIVGDDRGVQGCHAIRDAPPKCTACTLDSRAPAFLESRARSADDVQLLSHRHGTCQCTASQNMAAAPLACTIALAHQVRGPRSIVSFTTTRCDCSVPLSFARAFLFAPCVPQLCVERIAPIVVGSGSIRLSPTQILVHATMPL